MPYCDLEDIKDRIPEEDLIGLCFDGNPDDYATQPELEAAQAAAVDDVTTKAITDADAEIDAYCSGKYTVPMDPVPAMINKISAEIAVYNVFSRRQGATEDWEKRYKNAIDFLKGVAKGMVQLGSDTPEEATPGEHAPDIRSSTRIFDRDKLEGF